MGFDFTRAKVLLQVEIFGRRARKHRRARGARSRRSMRNGRSKRGYFRVTLLFLFPFFHLSLLSNL